MLRRWLARLMLLTCLSAVLPGAGGAAAAAPVARLVVDSRIVVPEHPLLMADGLVYMPLHELALVLQVQVAAAEAEAVLTDGTTIHRAPAPAMGGRPHIPAVAAARAFGWEAEWDPAGGALRLTSPWHRAGVDPASLQSLPGGGSGRPYVRALAEGGGSVYAATYRGLWRWDEPAQSWAELGLAAYDVFGVAVSPADTARVWAWSYGRAWASADGGGTWAPAEHLGGLGAMAFAPLAPAQGLAAAGRPEGDGTQVYRTRDGGRTWAAVAHLPAPGAPWALRFSPHAAGIAVLALNGGGLWATRDGGETWREITPPGTGGAGATPAFDPREPDTLYTWGIYQTWTDAGPVSGLFRTADGGATWAELPRPPGAGGGYAVWAVAWPGGVRLYADATPDGGRTIVLATSADAGQTWSVAAADLGGSPAALLERTGGELLLAGPGLLRFTPAAGWQPAPPPLAGADLAAVVQAGETLLAAGGALPGGLARSRDGGQTWVPAPLPAGAALPPLAAPAEGLGLLQAAGDAVYLRAVMAEADGGGRPWLGVSCDAGDTWTEVPLPPPARRPEFRHEPWRPVSAYLPLPDGQVLVALNLGAGGGASLWATRSGGIFWTELPLPELALYLAAGPDGALYAATGRGVWRSADAGRTWARSLSGLPAQAVSQVLPDPADPRRVYALTAAGPAASDDAAATWRAAGHVPAGPARRFPWAALAPVPGRPGWAAAATPAGVLVSADAARSWHLVRGTAPPPLGGYGPGALAPAGAAALLVWGYGRAPAELVLPEQWPTAPPAPAPDPPGATGRWTLLADQVPPHQPPVALALDGSTWVLAGGRRFPLAGDGAPAPLPAAVVGALLAPVPGRPAAAVAVAPGGRVHRTADAGATWTAGLPVAAPDWQEEANGVAVLGGDPQVLFRTFARPLIMGGYGAIEVSRDEGVTWETVRQGRATGLITAAADPDRAVARGDGGPVFSADGGRTWAPLPVQGPGTWALALHGGRIYAARGEAVLATADAGTTWTELGVPVPGMPVAALAVDPADPQVLYAAIGAALTPAGGARGIHRSADGGRTWARITDAIGNPPARHLAPTPAGALAVLTEAGELWLYRPEGAPLRQAD